MTALSALRGRGLARGGRATRAEERELSSNVRSSAIWNLASTLLLRMTGIVVTAVVAHILSPRDFGEFAVATTAFTIVSALGEFGVSSCLVRADLDLDALAPTMASISIFTSGLLAAGMAIWAHPIGSLLGSADAAGPVRVMALTVVVVGISAVPTAQCMRDFKQNKLFIANVLSFVPSTAILILLAATGSGAMAFAWSRLVGQITSSIVVFMSVRKNYLPGISRWALSVLYEFGIPMAVANFIGFILVNVDYALVGRYLGAVQLGSYVLAFNIASWSSALLSSVINSVSIPAFSRVKHDERLLRESIDTGLRAVAVVAMPMCSILMVISRPLVASLYGVRWVAAANVLSILSLYGAISVICLLFSGMLTGLGRSKFVLIVQVVWLAALFPAMTIGVHKDGIVGAAFAHIVVIGPIVLPCYLIALWRATGIKVRVLVRGLLPSLVAASLAAFAAKVVMSEVSGPPIQLVVGILTSGILYCLAIAPHAIVVLLRDKMIDPRIRRILRAYYKAGRMVGLQVGTMPKHAARGRSQAGRRSRMLARQPSSSSYRRSGLPSVQSLVGERHRAPQRPRQRKRKQRSRPGGARPRRRHRSRCQRTALPDHDPAGLAIAGRDRPGRPPDQRLRRRPPDPRPTRLPLPLVSLAAPPPGPRQLAPLQHPPRPTRHLKPADRKG